LTHAFLVLVTVGLSNVQKSLRNHWFRMRLNLKKNCTRDLIASCKFCH